MAVAAAAYREDGGRSLHRLSGALNTAASPLDSRCPRPTQRRRRHRSRNCRYFRLHGTYFQFTDAKTRSGRGHALGGSVDRQQARLRQQMEETRRRMQQLLEQHDLVESRRINTRNYAVSYATGMAHRFFELFGRGFDPVNHPIQSRQAEAFLRSVMREDALCTEFRGVDMFLKQYQVGTAIHESMALSLHRLVLLNTGDDSIQIKTEATASFRISRTTLEALFPSIIQDEPLAQQLIGREYKMQYDKVFHFADGRIYQHETRIDLCSGLLQLVGDPFLALKLFEASVLTKHGHWRIEEVAEDAHELPNTLL